MLSSTKFGMLMGASLHCLDSHVGLLLTKAKKRAEQKKTKKDKSMCLSSVFFGLTIRQGSQQLPLIGFANDFPVSETQNSTCTVVCTCFWFFAVGRWKDASQTISNKQTEKTVGNLSGPEMVNSRWSEYVG